MRKTFKFLFLGPRKSTVLFQLRERLLRIMLYGSFAIATVLFGLASIPALQKGLYATILIYSLLYIWTILITFIRRLPYHVRAIGWLGILYVFGSINLFLNGFNVDAGLFLLTFIAMSILLMDVSAGMVALLLASAAVSISGFVNVADNYIIPMGLPQSNPLLWIIGGVIFVLMGILLIYSLTIVVNGLEDNLEKTTLLAGELELANKALRISEARYRTLVDTSPGLVALFDVNGKVLMANPFGLALYGYECLDEVVGKNIVEFVPHHDRQRAGEVFREIIATGGFKDFTFPALRKDRSLFLGEFSSALVVDETGEPQAVIITGRDVTAREEARKHLQEAKEALDEKVAITTDQLTQTTVRLEELVKHGPAVIFSYRASDRAVTYISENVSALLGYEASQFTDDINFWHDHVHPDDKKSILFQAEQPENQMRSIYDYRFLKKDGTYCWLRAERLALLDKDGNLTEYVGSWSDITERKRTEETLRNSEAKYRSLYESMMDAYVRIDMSGTIELFNQAFQDMLGYEADELHKLTYKDLAPQRWQGFVAGIVEKQVLPNGFSDIYEMEYIRKDGTIFPVELRTVLVRDEASNPTGMWAIVRDISGRKIIDQILRESEARYRELLDNSMQGVVLFQDMRIAYVNKAITESLGYSRVELETLTQADVISRIHPDDRGMFQERLQAPPGKYPISERYSLRVIHKNGEIRWLEARTAPIVFQGKPAVMNTTIDVSDIRKVETELQESERIQRTILNASDALVLLVDTTGNLLSCNDKFVERMKIRNESLVGIPVNQLLPAEVAEARRIPFEKAINSGKPTTSVDCNGGVWFENNFYPILDATGKVESIAIYAHDITEQRRVTEALRTSEEQYRKLAEAAHDMIFIINREGLIQYVNSFGAKLLQKEPHELVGQPRERLFPPDTNQHQEDHIQQVFRTGDAFVSENANTFLGKTIWLNTWLVPLKDTSGEVTSVLGVSRDLTERKIAEEELQQARDLLEERVSERTKELMNSQEKLRLLTTQTINAQEAERRSIARELHDDAGQALITLKYSLSAIESVLPETDTSALHRLADAMKIIDQTNARIRSLAHNLRPPVLEIGGIDMSLRDYCQEQTERTQIPIYYRGIDVPGLPDEIGICLYRFVQEAFTNILRHAQASQVKVSLQYQKGEISVSVTDNGRGIDERMQSDGLGLLGIRERLALLGGRLEIHSRKGRGAKLVACIPWRLSSSN